MHVLSRTGVRPVALLLSLLILGLTGCASFVKKQYEARGTAPLDAAFASGNTAYLFKGNQLLRYDLGRRQAVGKPGYAPDSIADLRTIRPLAAAHDVRSGTAYLFGSTSVEAISTREMRSLGSPVPASTRFANVPPQPDAAFVSAGRELVVIKDSLRYFYALPSGNFLRTDFLAAAAELGFYYADAALKYPTPNGNGVLYLNDKGDHLMINDTYDNDRPNAPGAYLPWLNFNATDFPDPLPDPPVVADPDPVEVKTAFIRLPFGRERENVEYVVNELGEMMIGDMVIGDEQEVLARHGGLKRMPYYRGRDTIVPPRPFPNFGQPGNNTSTTSQPLTVTTNEHLLWPGGLIRYAFAAEVSRANRDSFNRHVSYLNEMTGLRVIPLRGDEAGDFLRINYLKNSDAAGRSSLGRKGNEQYISIADGYFNRRVVVHELLHAAGFIHEHSRPDRDNHVRLNLDPVPDRYVHNFRKYTTGYALALGEYDHCSIMHYSEMAFGTTKDENNMIIHNQTIFPIDENGDTLNLDCVGGDNLTQLDIEGVKSVYTPGNLSTFGGDGFNDGVRIVAAAAGDFDLNGSEEIMALLRVPGRRPEIMVLNDGDTGFGLAHRTGLVDFTVDDRVNRIAVGDGDALGQDRFVAISREVSTGPRVIVYTYSLASQQLRYEFAVGDDWPSGVYATDLVFGDFTGEGREELIISTNATSGPRLHVFTKSFYGGYRQTGTGGAEWGNGVIATSLAFAKMGQFGMPSLVVGRAGASSGAARFVIMESGQTFLTSPNGGQDEIIVDTLLWASHGGTDYGGAANVVDVAAANADGIPGDEIFVSRTTGMNMRIRAYNYNEANQTYSRQRDFGKDWDSYANGGVLAAGDLDGDGLAEFAFGRQARAYDRFWIRDDKNTNYAGLKNEGKNHNWYGDIDESSPGFFEDGKLTTSAQWNIPSSIVFAKIRGGQSSVVFMSFSRPLPGKPRWQIFDLNPPPTN